MTINELHVRYDGICVYATIAVKPSIIAIIILSFLNLFLLTIITILCMEKVPLAAVAFSLLEVFLIRFTLWNLYGEERLIINARSMSYQQHFGFFTTILRTIPFQKRISFIPYDEVRENEQCYSKLMFESYDHNNLPQLIYYSVLHLHERDLERFNNHINQLFVDEMTFSYEMPPVNLN